VGNIGFGTQATHTLDADDDQAAMPIVSLPAVLRHPAVHRNRQRDRQRFRDFVASRLAANARRLLKRVARLLEPKVKISGSENRSRVAAASLPEQQAKY